MKLCQTRLHIHVILALRARKAVVSGRTANISTANNWRESEGDRHALRPIMRPFVLPHLDAGELLGVGSFASWDTKNHTTFVAFARAMLDYNKQYLINHEIIYFFL